MRAKVRFACHDLAGTVEDATAFLERWTDREMLQFRAHAAAALGERDRASTTCARSSSARALELDVNDPTVLSVALRVRVQTNDEEEADELLRRSRRSRRITPPWLGSGPGSSCWGPGPSAAGRGGTRQEPPGSGRGTRGSRGRAREDRRPDRGIAALESARALLPEDPRFLEALAHAHLRHGDPTSARPLLATLLCRSSTSARSWRLQGAPHMQEKDPRAAIEAYSEALRRDPTQVGALVSRADARAELAPTPAGGRPPRATSRRR